MDINTNNKSKIRFLWFAAEFTDEPLIFRYIIVAVMILATLAITWMLKEFAVHAIIVDQLSHLKFWNFIPFGKIRSP